MLDEPKETSSHSLREILDTAFKTNFYALGEVYRCSIINKERNIFALIFTKKNKTITLSEDTSFIAANIHSLKTCRQNISPTGKNLQPTIKVDIVCLVPKFRPPPNWILLAYKSFISF